MNTQHLRYIVVNSDGEVERKFAFEDQALVFLQVRPEFSLIKIPKMHINIYQQMLEKVGEAHI
jgi:hypothetical protein